LPRRIVLHAGSPEPGAGIEIGRSLGRRTWVPAQARTAESFLMNFALMNFTGVKPAATTSAPVGAADLTVVGGGGHVGIPLVLAFAEAGYRVNVHYTNHAVLETLQSRRLPSLLYTPPT